MTFLNDQDQVCLSIQNSRSSWNFVFLNFTAEFFLIFPRTCPRGMEYLLWKQDELLWNLSFYSSLWNYWTWSNLWNVNLKLMEHFCHWKKALLLFNNIQIYYKEFFFFFINTLLYKYQIIINDFNSSERFWWLLTRLVHFKAS